MHKAGLVNDRVVGAGIREEEPDFEVAVIRHVKSGQTDHDGRDPARVRQYSARDATGRPVTGLKFQGRFQRPTDKRADLAIALAEVGTGSYRGRLEAIAPGQWDLVLEGGGSAGRLFLSKNRVMLN